MTADNSSERTAGHRSRTSGRSKTAVGGLDTWMHTLLQRLVAIEFKYTSLSARVFGDMGIVYSAFWWKGTMDGQPFTDSGFMADVWSRQSGSWQVVARRRRHNSKFCSFKQHEIRSAA